MAETSDDPLRRRLYRNPPVIEAMARFHRAEPTAWNVTTPGVVLERIRDLYPLEPQVQTTLQAGMFTGGEAEGTGPSLQVRTGSDRILFGAEGGSRQLAVSAEDISVHGHVPYEGWESLHHRLLEAAERINRALEIGQPTYSQVGLRYINKVEIEEQALRFDEYLTIGIGFPEGFPPAISAFLDRVEMQYPDEDVALAFTWASSPAPSGRLAFIIDLDLIASPSDPLTTESATAVLRDLKFKEGRAFEALLKDRLREQFGEIH